MKTRTAPAAAPLFPSIHAYVLLRTEYASPPQCKTGVRNSIFFILKIDYPHFEDSKFKFLHSCGKYFHTKTLNLCWDLQPIWLK